MPDTDRSSFRARSLSPASVRRALVQIHGIQVGRRYDLQQREHSIGRGLTRDIILAQPNVSRTHATVRVGSRAAHLCDAGSINGTFLNDVRVQEALLRNGARIRIGHTLLRYMEGADLDAQYTKILGWLSSYDGLTRAHNRRFWDAVGERELLRAQRFDRPLSLLLLNIRAMARVNAKFGFHAGDVLLTHLVMRLNTNMRKADVIARVSGDHFSIILPEVDGPGRERVAHKVQELIGSEPFPVLEQEIPIDVTVAGASFEQDDTWARLVGRASHGLRARKLI